MDKITEIDESIKYAWAYLIRHGKITNGKWCYYAGNWEEFDGNHNWPNWEKRKKELEKFRNMVVSIGIDWNKTGIPEVHHKFEFNGTENDSKDCLGTLGTLVLNDGKTFLLGSSDDDAAYLAKEAKELRKGKSEIMELAMKL